MSPYSITGYLIAMGISAVCACALFFFMLRKEALPSAGKALSVSLCVLVLGTAFAVLFAKLFYFLFYFFYISEQGIGEFWLSLRTEEMSYYGAVAGVCFSVSLIALIFRLRPGRILHVFAPAGALMAAAARFAEYFLFPTGTGLSSETPIPFPLAIRIVYDESYIEYVLAVFMLEGLMSLLVFAFSLRHRNDPYRFLRTLFYLCLPQVLLESLRSDALNWLFVHAEQLLCFLFVEGVLVWYGFACKKDSRKGLSSWVPALTGLGVCGLIIVGEFMLDGKIRIGGTYVSPWITYSLMAAGLVLLAVMEHKGHRRLQSSVK